MSMGSKLTKRKNGHHQIQLKPASILLSKISNGNVDIVELQKEKEDNQSIILLLILYTLQGIPMGLCGSIPLILKERKVSYEG
jgi:hypothetical protein